VYIKDMFHSNTGVSQYRLEESTSKDAVLYTLYGQNELYEDLTGVPGAMSDRKQIRTEYKGSTLKAGDLIFSTISGTATLVTRENTITNHKGNCTRVVCKDTQAAVNLIS